MSPSYPLTCQTMSSTSSQTFYTANSSPSSSSVGRTANTDSTTLSNNSYPYSVTSVNSYKSRKNVLYPRRMHPPLATTLTECIGIFSPDSEMLAWEVRYLCTDTLPHLETRLLPAGEVLLESLGKESDLGSQYKNEKTRYCSELFIMLAREIFLKGAIGVKELEGPCKLLDLTFKDLLVKPGAFDTPATSNLNEPDLRASCAETQGPEKVASVIRLIFSVMDAFEAALNVVNPLAASDEALEERRHQVSQNFSVVKDLTMDQYRKLLAQKLVQDHSLQSQATLEAKKNEETFRISSRDGQESITVARRPVDAEYDVSEASGADAVRQLQEFDEDKWGFPQAISIIEEGLEGEGGWDFVDFDSLSCSILMFDLIYGEKDQEKDQKPERQGFTRRFLRRFSPFSRVFVKKKG